MPEPSNVDCRNRQTLDQRRAAHAWEAVKRAKEAKSGKHNERDPKKFGGHARKLPMRILAAGLGQAVLFLEAKGEAPGLLDELADWLLVQRPSRTGQPPRLIEKIIGGDAATLRHLTEESLAYLQWLVRFAEAEGLTDSQED